ncbi:MAG: extracellular solute-binding protein [Spirochaetales bacterium]|nr:extracellular solute-binding protein [Spirochaetales bacterium]
MRGRVTAVLVAVLLLVASWAFTGGAQEKAGGPSGPILLKVRTMTHGDETKVETALVEQFVAEHPNIRVELNQGQWTEAYAQIRLGVMSGDPPHVFLSHILKVVEMNEYYTPLNASPVGNLLQMSGIEVSNFHEGAYKMGGYQGNQYILPLDNHGIMIWYNKDIFQEVGLDPAPEKFPDSMSAFTDAANKIKQAGYYAFHQAADGPPRYLRRSFFVWLWQQGGEIFDANYTRATFNNEKGLKALQFVVDNVHKHGWNVVGGDGYKQFSAGELGILHAGNWFYPNAVNSGVNFATWKVPNLFGKRQAWGNSEGFTILKQPEGTPKEVYLAAMTFIAWYLDHSYDWTIGSGMITAWAPAAQNPELKSSEYWQRVGQHLAAMMDEGALHFPIMHAKGAELENAITVNVELAFNGEITPQEALNRAEAECNKILK